MKKGNVFMCGADQHNSKTCKKGNLLVVVDIRVSSFCKETSPDLEFLLVLCTFGSLYIRGGGLCHMCRKPETVVFSVLSVLINFTTNSCDVKTRANLVFKAQRISLSICWFSGDGCQDPTQTCHDNK